MNINSRGETRRNAPVSPQQPKKELVRNTDRPQHMYTTVKQSPLQSADSGSKTDSFENDTGYIDVSKIQIVELKRDYELDYTAADALNNCWHASTDGNVFALYRSCAKVSDEAVSDMDKGEFLSYLRENGLDREISWAGVDRYVRGTKSFESFGEFSDYTAALFAALEARIKNDFSGDERKEQLEILNDRFEKTVGDFADQLTERARMGFGEELPEDKLADSIRGVIYGKKDAYGEYIQKHKDYAGIGGTADSWLRRDTGFMTRALINAYTPEASEQEDGLWSENDIISIGMLSKMYESDATVSKARAILQHKDEESLGLALSMCWLATEKITVDLKVSDSVKGLANGLFEKYAKTLIGDVNEALKKSRTNPLGASASAFGKLDEKSVYAVLNVMKKTYEESGDYEKAICTTAAFAHDTAVDKLQKQEYAQLWRYNKPVKDALDAKTFWNGFYNADSKSGQGNGMGKLIEKWNTFTHALASKNLREFTRNVSAGMFRGYTSSSFKGSVFGGYSNGKWWGTNLNDLVKK